VSKTNSVSQLKQGVTDPPGFICGADANGRRGLQKKSKEGTKR